VRPVLRLALGGIMVMVWFGVIAPQARGVLLQKRSLRFNTVNAHSLGFAVEWADQTGEIGGISLAVRTRIEEDSQEIRELMSSESQMCQAIWAILPEARRTQANAELPLHAPAPALTDPRFVDPYTPALIQAILRTYGYQRSDITLPTDPQTSLSMSNQLMVATQLINEEQLQPDQVAQILDAALRLDSAQRDRVRMEHELALSLPRPLLDLAIRMQLQRAPSRR
jgi:hypothetical protein